MKALKTLLKFTVGDKKRKRCILSDKIAQGLILCMNFINNFNVKDGMYIDTGIVAEVQELEKQLVSGTVSAKSFTTLKNPHSAAMALKGVISYLDPPIIPPTLYQEFLDLAVSNPNAAFIQTAAIEAAFDAIQPSLHKSLFEHFLAHLCDIVLQRSDPSVTHSSLSTAVGKEALRSGHSASLLASSRPAKTAGKDDEDVDLVQDSRDQAARVAAISNVLRWYSTTDAFLSTHHAPKTTADTTPLTTAHTTLPVSTFAGSTALSSESNNGTTEVEIVASDIVEDMLDRSIKITFPKKKDKSAAVDGSGTAPVDYEAFVRDIVGNYSDVANVGVKDGRLAVIMFETIRAALIYLPYLERELKPLGYKITYLGGGEMISVTTPSQLEQAPVANLAPPSSPTLDPVINGPLSSSSPTSAPNITLTSSPAGASAVILPDNNAKGWASAVVSTSAKTAANANATESPGSWATRRTSSENESLAKENDLVEFTESVAVPVSVSSTGVLPPLHPESVFNPSSRSVNHISLDSSSARRVESSDHSSYSIASDRDDGHEDDVAAFDHSNISNNRSRNRSHPTNSSNDVIAFSETNQHPSRESLSMESLDTMSGDDVVTVDKKEALISTRRSSNPGDVGRLNRSSSSPHDARITDAGALSDNSSSGGRRMKTTSESIQTSMAHDDVDHDIETKVVNPVLVRKISMSTLAPKSIQVLASPKSSQQKAGHFSRSDDDDADIGASQPGREADQSNNMLEHRSRTRSDSDSEGDLSFTYGGVGSSSVPSGNLTEDDSDVPDNATSIAPYPDKSEAVRKALLSSSSSSSTSTSAVWSASAKVSTAHVENNQSAPSTDTMGVSTKRVIVVSRRNLPPQSSDHVDEESSSSSVNVRSAVNPLSIAISSPSQNHRQPPHQQQQQITAKSPVSSTSTSPSSRASKLNYLSHRSSSASATSPHIRQSVSQSPEKKRLNFIREKEIIEVLQCRIQMLEAEAVVRERERQALEQENKKNEMDWTAELVSLRGRLKVLEQNAVESNATFRQLKIACAHKDGEISSLNGTVDILTRTQVDLQAKAERSSLHAVMSQKQLAHLLNMQLRTTDEAAKYSLAELSELRGVYQQAIEESMQWQVKARASALEIARLNQQIVSQALTVVGTPECHSPGSSEAHSSQTNDSLALSGASEEKVVNETAGQQNINPNTALSEPGRVGSDSIMMAALQDIAGSETDKYLKTVETDHIEAVTREAEALRSTLKVQAQEHTHQQTMRSQSLAAAESSEELTGISFVQARLETNDIRRQGNSMKDHRLKRAPSPTTADAASTNSVKFGQPTVSRDAPGSFLYQGRVPCSDERVGFADESVRVENNLPSKISSVEKLRQTDYEQRVAFGNFATTSSSSTLMPTLGTSRSAHSSNQTTASPLIEADYGRSAAYAIRGLNVDLAYTRKQLTSPASQSSPATTAHGRRNLNEPTSFDHDSKLVNDRDLGLLRKHGALKDTKLSSDTEELLNRIRQRQQDHTLTQQSLYGLDTASSQRGVAGVAGSSAYHRRQDLASSHQWFQNHRSGY